MRIIVNIKDEYAHSFAKAWLLRLGNQVLINGKDFLGINADKALKKFKIQPLKTWISIGTDLLDEKEIAQITEIPYQEMKHKFGLTVYSVPIDNVKVKPWVKNQRMVYVLEKKRIGISGEISYDNFNRMKLKLEWNRKDVTIRGVGHNFGTREGRFEKGDITPWVPYDTEQKSTRKTTLVTHDSYSEITDNLVELWTNKKFKNEQVMKINELPVMILEESELLCMPKTMPLPKILIVGKTGRGKSWALNSLMGRVFYIFQHRVGLLNDSLDQFYDLMLKAPKEFIPELSRVGNEPRNLPVVNLYMSCPNLNVRYNDEHIGYRLTIPLKEFLYRYEFYTKGVSKWDLGSPEKYLRKDVINAMQKCKTGKEVGKVLEGIIPNATEEKGIRQMIFKWESAFENIFRDEFTSNLFGHEETTSAYWKVKLSDGEEVTGHPFLVSMEAGLLPVVNNSKAKTRYIAKKHMANLLRKIIDWQIAKDEEKRKPTWICIDELRDFLKKKHDELYDSLDYLFTQGRFCKVGFIGSIQSYTTLSEDMKQNASHLIVFHIQTNEERNAIAKDYHISREVIDQLSNLKTFQCLFITKEKVIIYDKCGRRRVVEGGIWKGKIIPPITVHKSPK